MQNQNDNTGSHMGFTLLLLLMLLIAGCAFDRNVTNPLSLTKDKLTSINGVYEIRNNNADSVTRKYWIYNNFLTEIDRKQLSETLRLDSNKIYKFQLRVLNENRIKINYIEDDQIIRERVLKIKLKQDGYLYLKNKNTVFILIPYIAGALDIKKTRITCDENGNLIFDVVNHRSGAIGVIGFLDGRTWKYRHQYQRF